MLAAAVLTIAAALDHACHPDRPHLIPLTRNEIAYLLDASAIGPRTTPGTASAGRGSDAATSTGPASATTGGKPAKTPSAARTSFSI